MYSEKPKYNAVVEVISRVFAIASPYLRIRANGILDACIPCVQQLGNGAIVKRLSSGRSF